MNSVREMHQQAMEYADKALLSRMRGEREQAVAFFKEASELEFQAAKIFLEQYDAEPTRSVLLRSAASLILEAGEEREAERMVAMALIGNPTPDIAEELRQLQERINFKRHMSLRGISLANNEFQFSITGKETSYGIAPSEAVIDRLESLKTIVYRTFERLEGINYRVGGISSLASMFPVFFAVPVPSSFAMTLKIGHPDQPTIPGFEDIDRPTQVVQEIMDCIEIINGRDEERLRQRIITPAYYNNFIGLMNKIAPDGEQISGVGFTSVTRGKERHVSLIRKQEEIANIPKVLSSEEIEALKGERIHLKGKLLFADALSATSTSEGKIKLKADDRKPYTIIVPEGMDDIVRPLWSQIVIVTGRRKRNDIYLENIVKASN